MKREKATPCLPSTVRVNYFHCSFLNTNYLVLDTDNKRKRTKSMSERTEGGDCDGGRDGGVWSTRRQIREWQKVEHEWVNRTGDGQCSTSWRGVCRCPSRAWLTTVPAPSQAPNALCSRSTIHAAPSWLSRSISSRFSLMPKSTSKARRNNSDSGFSALTRIVLNLFSIHIFESNF